MDELPPLPESFATESHPFKYTTEQLQAFARQAVKQERERLPLTESDAFALIGHAVLLQGQGETDMPAFFRDLAARIFEAMGDPAAAIRARSSMESKEWLRN